MRLLPLRTESRVDVEEYADQEFARWDRDPALRLQRVLQGLDRSRDHMREDAESNRDEIEAAIAAIEGAGLAISTSLIALTARGGSLLAIALSSIPAWGRVDPLPVLSLSEEQRKQREDELREAEEDEDLESIEFRRLFDQD